MLASPPPSPTSPCSPTPQPPPHRLPPGLTIHQCKGDEGPHLFHGWAARMGWNPGQKAAMREVMLKTDPGVYFYARLDSSHFITKDLLEHKEEEDEVEEEKEHRKEAVVIKGKEKVPLEEDRGIVSIISAIRFGDDQAWLGCYLTSEDQRGKGYGLALFNHALNHLGKYRKSIGLNAVMSQVPNYQKSGFTKSSWMNERRRGAASDIVKDNDRRKLAEETAKGAEDEGEAVEGVVVLLSDPRVDQDQLYKMEKRYTGLDRPEFIKSWVDYHAHGDASTHHRVGIAVLSSTKTDPYSGKPLLLGYGCTRPAIISYRLGPLYATDGKVARQLLVKIAIDVIAAEKRDPLGVPLMFDVDIVQENKSAVEIFDKIGWPNVVSSLRMWRGVVPPYEANGCFGIATGEAG